MSSMTETVLVKEESQKNEKDHLIAISVPGKIKEYLRLGDSITLDAVIVENQLKLTLTKLIYNFGIADVAKLSDEAGFKTEYNSTQDGITVFASHKDDLTLSYTQYRRDIIQPAHVVVSKKLANVDYDAYEDISLRASKMKNKFNVTVRPDGDIDVIRVIRDPKRYKLTRKKAFNLIEKGGHKAGMVVTCRLNSKNNSIEEIKDFIAESAKLNL